MARAATPQEIQQVLARGYSQGEIDRFARDNPGDGNRLLEAFPAKTPTAATAPSAAPTATPVPQVSAGGGAAPAGSGVSAATAGAVAGMNKVVDPGTGSGLVPDQASSGLGGGGGAGGSGGGVAPNLGAAQQALRALGNRIYPDSGMALQRKAY